MFINVHVSTILFLFKIIFSNNFNSFLISVFAMTDTRGGTGFFDILEKLQKMFPHCWLTNAPNNCIAAIEDVKSLQKELLQNSSTFDHFLACVRLSLQRYAFQSKRWHYWALDVSELIPDNCIPFVHRLSAEEEQQIKQTQLKQIWDGASAEYKERAMETPLFVETVAVEMFGALFQGIGQKPSNMQGTDFQLEIDGIPSACLQKTKDIMVSGLDLWQHDKPKVVSVQIRYVNGFIREVCVCHPIDVGDARLKSTRKCLELSLKGNVVTRISTMEEFLLILMNMRDCLYENGEDKNFPHHIYADITPLKTGERIVDLVLLWRSIHDFLYLWTWVEGPRPTANIFHFAFAILASGNSISSGFPGISAMEIWDFCLDGGLELLICQNAIQLKEQGSGMKEPCNFEFEENTLYTFVLAFYWQRNAKEDAHEIIKKILDDKNVVLQQQNLTNHEQSMKGKAEIRRIWWIFHYFTMYWKDLKHDFAKRLWDPFSRTEGKSICGWQRTSGGVVEMATDVHFF